MTQTPSKPSNNMTPSRTREMSAGGGDGVGRKTVAPQMLAPLDTLSREREVPKATSPQAELKPIHETSTLTMENSSTIDSTMNFKLEPHEVKYQQLLQHLNQAANKPGGGGGEQLLNP